jgi:hypothetical protein
MTYRVTVTTPERPGAARIDVEAEGPGEAIRRVVRAAAWMTPGWRADPTINEARSLDTAAAYQGAWQAVARPLDEAQR